MSRAPTRAVILHSGGFAVLLVVVAISLCGFAPCLAADQPFGARSPEVGGWPSRYPVVLCGDRPQTVLVDSDPQALEKTGSTPTQGPIISHGTRRIIYTIVDMLNVDHPQSQAETDHMMGLIEAYWEGMSHGRLDIEMTAAGRVFVPYSTEPTCHLGTWTEAVDAVVGGMFDLYQYDGRVYFFPESGPCSQLGGATMAGNPELPIYTGGCANQTWVLIPNAEFIVAHEMGHNFGLHHGSTPDSSLGPGEEYGDCSTIMGSYNFQFPQFFRELRGLHGVNRVWLGWSEPITEMANRTYTLYASELADPPGPQILAVPHPWFGVWYRPSVFFLSYRSGSDGILADGSFAPLLDEYTRGVGVRLAEYQYPQRTSLFRVLEDGESFSFEDPLHEEHRYFLVHQVSHDPEKVTFNLTFFPDPSEESLAAGTCNDGTDNDGDWRMDFAGGADWATGRHRPPEGLPCMMTWESLIAPSSAAVGDRFLVVCKSEFPGVEGFGPLGEGLLGTTRDATGLYAGRFEAETCGELSVTCGTTAPGAFVRDQLEATIDITCSYGETCDHGTCVAFPSPPRRQSDE